MATFIHLTSAKLTGRIRRGGIKPDARYGKRSPGVYAMPVVPNYFTLHQWVRELRKWGRGPIADVYFRIADEELVRIGPYNREHKLMTAVQAAAAVMELRQNTLGYEVIIPHLIPLAAIVRMRLISSRVGWRHFPGSHDRQPCGCPACVGRGEYNSGRLRED